ncbi:MAG TPA: hypothetical protein VE890_09195 [Thermoguttaceae bacterium]|nr:hypothetical protein [Thermoguttaceae bacterium]
MEQQKYDSPAGCLLRIFWMMIGNVILACCAFGILQHRSSVLSIADILYWAAVGSLLAARFVDVRHLDGKTAEGSPATMAHWRRYAAALSAASMGIWVVAHAIARYWT